MKRAPTQGMPSESDLIRRIYAQRERWVDVGDRKEICVRRPDRWDSLSFLRDRTADRICGQVVNWRGFTEADVLGEGVGTVEEVAFGSDLFRVLAGDRLDWLEKIVDTLTEMIAELSEQAESTAKN